MGGPLDSVEVRKGFLEEGMVFKGAKDSANHESGEQWRAFQQDGKEGLGM